MRDHSEAAARLYDLVNALETDPHCDRPGDAMLAALVTLRELRRELNGWEPALISAARDRGVSWSRLAPALGVTSRQAAERRFLRLRPAPDGETTAEARVQAVRDRRAGDRAVSVWARENAASLRQVAGEVSAVDGLTASGDREVGRVRDALAEDDPSALLSPLGEAHPHLEAGHTALAARIDALTQHAEQARAASRTRRNQDAGQGGAAVRGLPPNAAPPLR